MMADHGRSKSFSVRLVTLGPFLLFSLAISVVIVHVVGADNGRLDDSNNSKPLNPENSEQAASFDELVRRDFANAVWIAKTFDYANKNLAKAVIIFRHAKFEHSKLNDPGFAL